MRRVVAGGVASALMLSVAAFPALATNDGTVPADTASCNPKAVGQPFSPTGNATDIGPSPVSDDPATSGSDPGPASVDNPGQARSQGDTGAEGQEKSQAPNNCL